MNSPVRALYKIDARPDGPAQARHIVVRECARRVSERTLEDFELLVSELVTNRILHGAPGADNTVLLDLRINSMLQCAVSDHGSGIGCRDDRLSAAVHNERAVGRPAGLRLVNRLANRWGSHRTRTGGTRVCARPPSLSPPRPRDTASGRLPSRLPLGNCVLPPVVGFPPSRGSSASCWTRRPIA